MKKIPLLLLLLISIFSGSFTSAPETQPLSKEERLFLTCKIWGFLKYYHPKVGTGAYDWDEKLVGVLANTGHIQDADQLSTYFSRWIHVFGPRNKCASCNQRSKFERFDQNFDLSWTRDRAFSEELKRTFRDIEFNRFQGDHHYIGIGKNGQFEPKNEPKHIALNWKDEHWRLMALFRYWNYIEYFYPHKYSLDISWDEVLRQMIPKFLTATTKLAFHQALLELVVMTQDSYAGLTSPTLNDMPYYNYLPAEFQLIEEQAVITNIIDREKAYNEDLRVGDAITHINQQTVRALHDSHTGYVWGSNERVKERSLYHTLFMGFKEAPNVTLDREGRTMSKTLNVYPYAEISYTSSPDAPVAVSPDSVGYIDLSKTSAAAFSNAMTEMKDRAVLIFDLRDLPKISHRVLSSHLYPSDTVFARYLKPDVSYPGKYVWQGMAGVGQDNEDYFKGKVLVLINEHTQGHAEFVAMSLMAAPDVLAIGRPTAGTVGGVSQFPIYDKLMTSFTGTGVFHSDFSPVQRVGLTPDVAVARTVAGVRAGKDEVLEEAYVQAIAEIQKRVEEERMRQAALDSIRRDSIRRDSLRLDSLRQLELGAYAGSDSSAVDSLLTDSLQVEDYDP